MNEKQTKNQNESRMLNLIECVCIRIKWTHAHKTKLNEFDESHWVELDIRHWPSINRNVFDFSVSWMLYAVHLFDVIETYLNVDVPCILASSLTCNLQKARNISLQLNAQIHAAMPGYALPLNSNELLQMNKRYRYQQCHLAFTRLHVNK